MATLEDFESLPGIGPTLAQKIIDYREQNWFSEIEDIMNVSGISQSIFDEIKDLITVNGGGSGFSYNKTDFTISIIDGNDAPTNIALSNSRIAENKPVDTVIGTFIAIDPEVNDRFIYSLCDATDKDFFNLIGNTLKVKTTLDYETKKTYNICIQVIDLQGFTFSKSFTIQILDVRDEIPPQTSAKNYLKRISGTSMSYVFTFTSSEANSRFMCELDAGIYSPCLAPKTYSKLPQGSHTFYVYAIDPSGNADQTPVSINFLVR
jgi:competence ComEA-like helix-hairpin-helix protein